VSTDDGTVFVIRDHSTFPEPLITVDYDAEGNVIKIVAVGNAARELAHATGNVDRADQRREYRRRSDRSAGVTRRPAGRDPQHRDDADGIDERSDHR
jgi:hypothetical protein